MGKKLDDDLVAKQHIANSPDITSTGDEVIKRETQKEAVESASGTASFEITEADMRVSRVGAKGLNSVYNGLTGKQFDDDQVSAVTEIFGIMFGYAREFSMPNWARLIMLLGVVSIPFVPLAFAFGKGSKEKEVNNG